MKSGITEAVNFKIRFESLIQNLVDKTSLVEGSFNKIIENATKNNYEYIDKLIKSHGLESNDILRKKYLDKITTYVKNYGDISLPVHLDMNMYFTDPYYRQQMVELYDIFKSSINILDVINHAPNFYTMLEYLNFTVQKCSKSAKGEFIFNNLTKLWDRSIINDEGLSLPYHIDETAIKDT